MKANEVPETYPMQFKDKIDEYLWKEHQILGGCCSSVESLKYSVAREVTEKLTDAFIEKTLKWYCLDCACNDNCAANHKCAFWSFFKDYLEGNDKALPPKISNAFNPDGSTTENYHYRHIIKRMRDDFIEKACEWLKEYGGSYWMDDYDLPTDDLVKDFRNYMKGE